MEEHRQGRRVRPTRMGRLAASPCAQGANPVCLFSCYAFCNVWLTKYVLAHFVLCVLVSQAGVLSLTAVVLSWLLDLVVAGVGCTIAIVLAGLLVVMQLHRHAFIEVSCIHRACITRSQSTITHQGRGPFPNYQPTVHSPISPTYLVKRQSPFLTKTGYVVPLCLWS